MATPNMDIPSNIDKLELYELSNLFLSIMKKNKASYDKNSIFVEGTMFSYKIIKLFLLTMIIIIGYTNNDILMFLIWSSIFIVLTINFDSIIFKSYLTYRVSGKILKEFSQHLDNKKYDIVYLYPYASSISDGILSDFTIGLLCK